MRAGQIYRERNVRRVEEREKRLTCGDIGFELLEAYLLAPPLLSAPRRTKAQFRDNRPELYISN